MVELEDTVDRSKPSRPAPQGARINYAAAAPVAGATGHPAGTRNAAVPAVLERYAAAHPFGTDALKSTQATDRIVDEHFRDASHRQGKAVSSPRIPFYTPKMLAAHLNREDRLYQPPSPLSAASETPVSDGFNWSDWAIGLGSGIALILALGGDRPPKTASRADNLDSSFQAHWAGRMARPVTRIRPTPGVAVVSTPEAPERRH